MLNEMLKNYKNWSILSLIISEGILILILALFINNKADVLLVVSLTINSVFFMNLYKTNAMRHKVLKKAVEDYEELQRYKERSN